MLKNLTLFCRQARSGPDRWSRLLHLLLLLVLPVLGKAQTLTQADFTGVVVPQYMASGTATRLPVLYRATVSNLTPSTIYRYYTQAATNSTTGGGTVDIGTTNTGAGNPLLIRNSVGTYTYYTGSVNLATAGSYETFQTDATGSFTGWFGFVNTGNARFTGGNVVFPTITLGKDATPTVTEKRLALNQGITVLNFATAAAAPNGTFLKGDSFATPRNIVAVYDNASGTGRPLGVTVVEPIGVTIASTVPNYGTTSGSWNTIIPNVNPNGVQRVEERSVLSGAVLNCNSDADGTWPSGAVTVNPTGGTTPVQLTSTDAPLNAGCGAVGTPTITVSTNGPLTFSTTTGTNSAVQTYTVAGTNLTADITVTAPAGFQISSNGTTYSSSLTLAQTGGSVASTIISVQLLGATAGTFSGSITNVSGAATQSVAVSGTVGTSGPAAPTITSFTPTSGPVGTTVTLTGTDFTGATAVTFSGTSAAFTVTSNTQLVATVPTGANSGAISVTTPAGTGSSTTNFTVTVPTPPTIASFTPASGPVGTTVTITGTNFTGATAVTFNGITAAFTVVNATTITATVPTGAATGTIAVTSPNGTATSATSFTVTAPAPAIASFTPTSGPVGTTVTITGTDFTGATAVAFNGTAATTFSVSSATSITAVVPTGATTGPISVTTPGGTATSATNFTITVPAAAVTALAPAIRVQNSAGFNLTVTGTGFVTGAVVTLNGTALTTTFNSATSLTAAVPATALTTAGTYNVTVTNPGAAASAPTTFTVSGATAALFEDFEQNTKTSYTAGTVALQSGDWTLADALIGTTTSDRFNGTRGVRVRGGGSVSMNFDKPNGAGVITLNAALYGADTGVSLKLEVSTDGGTTYTDITGTAPTLTATLASYAFTANRPGNVRIRVSSTNTVAASNPRFNLDDITITDYSAPATPVITVTPAALSAFATATGTASATQTFTAGGTNLTADLTVTAPAGYEVSLSATTGFAAALTLTPTNGTVNTTTVYVRLTGATAGPFAGNVAVSSPGATTQNVAVTGTVTTPAPTIVSFTPASGVVGTTVTITGTNFTGATAVTFNGATAAFTVVNATTITATVPATATTGAISVTTPGGTAASATNFTVVQPNPVPTIAGLAPNSAVAGSAAVTITLTGTNYLASSVVSFGSTPLATTFVSATSLTAVVPASLLTTAGSFSITVTNPAPGGGTSAPFGFVVFPATPAPTIVSFTPASGPVGTVVTITGTNLTGATAVTFNGATAAFTVVNATTITATVPATASTGTIAVTTPGGTATSATSFTVVQPNPVPTIVSLSPNTKVAGSVGFTLTVTGTGFVTGSVVSFGGTALATTFVSATSLTAVVPASAVATVGVFNVTVTSPAPGGGTSAPATFSVTTGTASQSAQSLAGFALYPNPTRGQLTIELPTSWNGLNQPVRLTDLAGRVVLQARLAANGRLDLGSLATGVYLLTVGEGTQSVTRRVVKE